MSSSEYEEDVGMSLEELQSSLTEIKPLKMRDMLLDDSLIIDTINDYLKFAAGGTIDLSCFSPKYFEKVIHYHYENWESYFSAINNNKKNIHNYKFIDYFIFSIITKFLCVTKDIILDVRNIVEYFQLFERACYLYYPEILNESSFEGGNFLVDYKFFAIAIYVAILYSECLQIRQLSRDKIHSSIRKDDTRKTALLKNMRDKVKCDSIQLDSIGTFLSKMNESVIRDGYYQSYLDGDMSRDEANILRVSGGKKREKTQNKINKTKKRENGKNIKKRNVNRNNSNFRCLKLKTKKSKQRLIYKKNKYTRKSKNFNKSKLD